MNGRFEAYEVALAMVAALRLAVETLARQDRVLADQMRGGGAVGAGAGEDLGLRRRGRLGGRGCPAGPRAGDAVAVDAWAGVRPVHVLVAVAVNVPVAVTVPMAVAGSVTGLRGRPRERT